ncbi:MAG: hypothetical protein R3B90_01875 [Planctomycetaceae bacterium]
MTSDWQLIVVLIAVAWAAIIVGRRVWRFLTSGGSACGDCSTGCGKGQSTELVTLSLGDLGTPETSSRA